MSEFGRALEHWCNCTEYSIEDLETRLNMLEFASGSLTLHIRQILEDKGNRICWPFDDASETWQAFIICIAKIWGNLAADDIVIGMVRDILYSSGLSLRTRQMSFE